MPVSDRQEKGDVIYRQDAISVLGAQCKKEYNKTCGEHCECMEYMVLRDMPSARKKGHWIEDGYTHYKAVCSECGEPCATYAMDKPRDRFCKWCGADMRGDGDG